MTSTPTLESPAIPDDVMQAARKLCDALIQAWLLHHNREEAAEHAVRFILADRETRVSSVRRGALDAQAIKTLINDGKVFADTDPEARFIYDAENACPHCGGSGHKDDLTSRGGWDFNITAAPKDKRLWLASKCEKVIGPISWDEKRGQFAGFATAGSPPIAWQLYVVPKHPGVGVDAPVSKIDHEFLSAVVGEGGV